VAGETFRSAALSLCALLVLSAPALAQRGQTIRDLTVEVGEQTSLSAAGVRSYSEGVRGVVDVRLTDDQSRFILVGERPGRTSLLLIMRDGSQVQYRITVPGGEEEETPEGRVERRESIRLDLYFVQLSDTYSHAIGLNFPASIGSNRSQGLIQVDWASGTGTETQIQLLTRTLLPRLDIAQSNGWARLYRQASLVTVNGQQAQINIGGEVNVALAGSLQNTLEQIEFGTQLTCTPRYDPETGRIEIAVNADVSDLTDDRGTGFPGRSVSTLNTLVNLELGQAVVLGGVISRTENRTKSGLPGLSQIPILGALFGSHSRRFEEAETLLFIVPTVTEPVPLQQRNRIQEAIRMYEDFEGGVDEIELVEQPRIPGARTVVPSSEDAD